MGKAACSAKGCTLDAYAKGWCRAHYARVRRKGKPGAEPLRTHAIDPDDQLVRVTVAIPQHLLRVLKKEAKQEKRSTYALASELFRRVLEGRAAAACVAASVKAWGGL